MAINNVTMATSLEKILENHHISKYRLIQAISKVKNERSFWGAKIAGKTRISQEELNSIDGFLVSQGINENIEVTPDKYFIT